MTPFKLLPVFVLFLLVAPIAFAQTQIFGNPLLTYTANTVILFAVLYLIQGFFLASERSQGKNKVFGGLVALALAAILSWYLVGGQGMIWETGYFANFFNPQFVVNTVFISILGYVGVRLLTKDQFSGYNAQEKTGVLIPIILLAGLIASRMSYYFWQAGTGQAIVQYLFGPTGILTVNDNRVFIFISGVVLFSWLFSYFRISPETSGGGNRLNYVMATIIAASLASKESVMELSTMIWIGEAIAFLVIGSNLGKQFGRWGWALAFGLVTYISYAAFGDDSFLSFFWSGFDIGTGNFILVIGLLIVLGILFVVFRSFRGGARGAGNFAKQGGKHLLNKILGGLRRGGPALSGIGKFFNRTPLKGQLPEMVREIPVEIMTLYNYISRLHTLKGKRMALDQIYQDIRNNAIANPNWNSREKLWKALVQNKTGDGKDLGWAEINSRIVWGIFQGLRNDLQYTPGAGNILKYGGKPPGESGEWADHLWISQGHQDRAKNANDKLRIYRENKEDGSPGIFESIGRHNLMYGRYLEASQLFNITKNPLKSVSQVANFQAEIHELIKEWDRFFIDLQTGKYHPFSRSFVDYESLIRERNYNFNNVGHTTPDISRPAFDVEALKDPGFFHYEGKEKASPYPTLSTRGLSLFIANIVSSDVGGDDQHLQILNEIIGDMGKTDQSATFSTLKGISKSNEARR